MSHHFYSAGLAAYISSLQSDLGVTWAAVVWLVLAALWVGIGVADWRVSRRLARARKAIEGLR